MHDTWSCAELVLVVMSARNSCENAYGIFGVSER